MFCFGEEKKREVSMFFLHIYIYVWSAYSRDTDPPRVSVDTEMYLLK